ncbi:hypothetical protein Scep_004812 [Stephania cephalantha]|uniref:Uncharacterized protein n=1 Tax=Stephania cephalantha TaxID=152367 RepID=A0AAP0KUJ1_9MAGN
MHNGHEFLLICLIEIYFYIWRPMLNMIRINFLMVAIFVFISMAWEEGLFFGISVWENENRLSLLLTQPSRSKN